MSTRPADTGVDVSHHDKFSTTIQIGDHVVFSYYDGIEVGEVLKFTPKMVRVSNFGLKKKKNKGKHFYPDQLVVIDDEKVMMYILTKV